MHTPKRVPWVTPKPLQGPLALEYLEESSRQGWYSNDGPCTLKTAKILHSHMQLPETKKVLLCASGTAALHTVVAAFNQCAGRSLTWATQAATFPSSVLGPLKDFHIVVDNDPCLHGPCLMGLEAVAGRIQGIIVTNLFGMACDIEAYTEWCTRHGKLCIFDNAASPMTFWKGTNTCAFGDAAIISLHETKPLGRGEGGAVVCGADFAPIVHRTMNFGFEFGKPVSARLCQPCASNWRMSDIAAAFIRARLQLLTSEAYDAVDAMVRHADALLKRPDICPHLRWVVPIRDAVTTLFPSCFLLYAAKPIDVAAFSEFYGIEARQYYVPLAEDAPVAWDWFKHCICLPFDYTARTFEGVDFVFESLIAWILSKNV